MQEAFREHHGLQCGFCTPGMIMTAVDIVNRKGSSLDEHTIRDELEGNICRCTGYHNIVKADRRRAPQAMGRPVAAGRGMTAVRVIERERGPSHASVERRGPLRSQPRRRPKTQGRNTMTATGIGASGKPQGRPALHHRQGPVHRRHQPPGPDLRLFRALAARACHHQARSMPPPRRRRPACSPCSPARISPADKVGGLICGWMIHSKDGSPMKAGAASGAGPGQGALRRRPRRRRHRRDAGAGQGRGRGDRRRLRGAAGRRRRRRRRRTRGQPQIHDGRARQHGLSAGTSATRPRSTRPSPAPST